jgi:hypothetical protein
MSVTTEELVAELERCLGQEIGHLERRQYDYQTSFALEELDVSLDGGHPLRLIFKDVGPRALARGAGSVKPRFLYEPLREIETYQAILAPLDLGTARCYGAVTDARRGRFWLFLEKVAGIELWQCELEIWQQVAGWLAGLHETCRDARADHLLRYDRDAYLIWLRRAQEFVGGSELDRIEAGYGPVVDRLLALSTGFIHGEFTASNVLVQERTDGLRVCPVDWEMAAVGPALLDLAALTVGSWNDKERDAIISAYYEALPAIARLPRLEFAYALDCARLFIALRWLGWAPIWSPPPEHAHDWLAEAVASAERLGV